MDLNEFIQETLSQIIQGVKDTQEYALKNGACINPNRFGAISPKAIMTVGNDDISVIQKVDFEVSLTSTSSSSGKASIRVLSGDIAKETSAINKVKFSIILTLPTMKPNF